MGTRAAEIGPSVSACSQHSLVGSKSVKGAVLHVEGNHTNTLAILHDQIKSKVLDKEVGVVAKGLTVKRME